MSGVGGKSKFTKAVQAKIVKHLRSGAYRRHAAEAAGVSDDTLRDWLVRGAAGEAPFDALAREVRRVQAEDAIRNQALITKAAYSDWKAAAWNLEKKYPTLYGRGAASPAVGVTIASGAADSGAADSGDTDSGNKTRIEFYLPDNGRRPDLTTDADEPAEEEDSEADE